MLADRQRRAARRAVSIAVVVVAILALALIGWILTADREPARQAQHASDAFPTEVPGAQPFVEAVAAVRPLSDFGLRI
jgi:energy-converting hydrogenase Eha subunit A